VPVYNVAGATRPGKISLQGDAVKIYRPQVTNNSKGNARPAPPAVVTKDQFLKNKTQRNTGVSGNNGARRAKQINQPSQQVEKKQAQQQDNNRSESRKQKNPPVQRAEQKNITKAPEPRQQKNQPSQQIERRQIPQQNNHRQLMQEPRQQISQPSPQQKPEQSKPVNKGKGKGNN